jgi:tetratricopeptide (TPR) repeat protein
MGETAFTLGQFHFARGEYRQAAETFARAAARLAPERKSDARYWQGLALLAVQQSDEARGVLTEIAEVDGPRRADAALGVAWSWEQAHRPDRAAGGGELLERGEVGPAALNTRWRSQANWGNPTGRAGRVTGCSTSTSKSVEAARVAPAASGAGAWPGYAVQIGDRRSRSRACTGRSRSARGLRPGSGRHARGRLGAHQRGGDRRLHESR